MTSRSLNGAGDCRAGLVSWDQMPEHVTEQLLQSIDLYSLAPLVTTSRLFHAAFKARLKRRLQSMAAEVHALYGAAPVESLFHSLCECLSRRSLQVPSWTITCDGTIHVDSSTAPPTSSPTSTTSTSSQLHGNGSGLEEELVVRVDTNITAAADGRFPLLLLYCHFVGTRDRLLLFSDVESLRTYACIISPVAPHLLALLADAFRGIPPAGTAERSPPRVPTLGRGIGDEAIPHPAPVSGDAQGVAGTHAAPVSVGTPGSAGGHAPYLAITHLKWTRDWESVEGAAVPHRGPGTAGHAGGALGDGAPSPALATVEGVRGSGAGIAGPSGLEDAPLPDLETHVSGRGSGWGRAASAPRPEVPEGVASAQGVQERHAQVVNGRLGVSWGEVEEATSVDVNQGQAAGNSIVPQDSEGATSLHNNQEQAAGISIVPPGGGTSVLNREEENVEGHVSSQESTGAASLHDRAEQEQQVEGHITHDGQAVHTVGGTGAAGANVGEGFEMGTNTDQAQERSGEGVSQSRDPRSEAAGERVRLLCCDEILGAALQAVVGSQQGIRTADRPTLTGSVATMDRMFVGIGKMAPFTKLLPACSVHVWPR